MNMPENRILGKLNQHGFVVAGSEEEARAVKLAAQEQFHITADIIRLGPVQWVVFKPEELDAWIEVGIFRRELGIVRKDGKPIERF